MLWPRAISFKYSIKETYTKGNHQQCRCLLLVIFRHHYHHQNVDGNCMPKRKGKNESECYLKEQVKDEKEIETYKLISKLSNFLNLLLGIWSSKDVKTFLIRHYSRTSSSPNLIFIHKQILFKMNFLLSLLSLLLFIKRCVNETVNCASL